MSATERDSSAPIRPGSPLAKALDDYPVPGLPSGFAERVCAAAEARSAPLPPPLRRASRTRRGWRTGQRIAIGIVSFAALATTAAATGLLQRFDLAVPSAETVWASISGTAPAAPPAARASAAEPVPIAPAATAAPQSTAAALTPAERAKVFRRIDEVRQTRRDARAARADTRFDDAIERRRAAGLAVPTAQEEAALRQRITDARTRRQQRADEVRKARRAELERRLEQSAAPTNTGAP